MLDFPSRTNIEAHLVHTRAIARWRALRATEASVPLAMDTATACQPVESGGPFLAFENFPECHVMRYEATFRRQFLRAFARLMDLRHSREQRKTTKIACDLPTQKVIESKSAAPRRKPAARVKLLGVFSDLLANQKSETP
jgi:hypothetical protein